MKRAIILLFALLCTGCTALPAEERAFAVALGIDRTDAQWQVFARIPTYQTDGGYTTIDASGDTLPAALAAIDAASPMRLHLDQLRLLVFSRSLAETAAFSDAMGVLSTRHDLRMQAAVGVTEADVKALMEALEPTTGSRLSKSIDVLLETRIEQGRIPAAMLSDILRMEERQSPLLMDIRLSGKDVTFSGGWPLSLNGSLEAPPLSAEDMQLLTLMQGRFRQTTLVLPDGTARIIDATAKPTLSDTGATLQLTLRCTASTWTAEGLRLALATACQDLLTRLAAANCDALALGRQAIRRTPDIAAWHALDWPRTYQTTPWTIQVGVQMAAQ